MICQDIREMLSPYVDDVLSSEEKAAVDLHLTKCLACRQELISLQEVIQLVRGLDEIELPADFRLKLHKRLTELEVGEQKASKVSWFARYRRPVWLSAAAAAACLAVGLYWGSFFGDQPGNVAYNPPSQPVQTSPSGEVVDPGPTVVPNPPPDTNLNPNSDPSPSTPGKQNPGTGNVTTPPPDNGVPVVPPEPPKPTIRGVTIEEWQGARLSKEAEIKLDPDNDGAIAKQLKELATAVDGGLTGPSKNGSDFQAVLWVPANNLDQALDSLGKLGKVTDSKTSQNDVSADYNATYSQLENLLVEEWELQKNPDLATDDQLQSDLTELQTEIKNAEEHLQNLVDSINKAMIKIYLITEK